MGKVLKADFFARSADKVAPELLGKYLVRNVGSKEVACKITEVEAYLGEEDLASHARFGNRGRSEVMYGHPGIWYVYLIYGMYRMLNVITSSHGEPSAVLIRGVAGISGPGRVTKALKVSKALHGKEVLPASGLWIEDRGEVVKKSDILRTPRIGIDYAGPFWSQQLYRYVLNDRGEVKK